MQFPALPKQPEHHQGIEHAQVVDGTSSKPNQSASLLATPLAPYLKSIPTDPETGTATNTGYSIEVDAKNIVTVTADDAENGESINVSR